MLIALCGPACAGKSTIAEYLVTELGFSFVEQTSLLVGPSIPVESETECDRSYKSITPSQALLSQCWKQDINVVIRNIHPLDSILPELLRRPYFLLVYVDGPLLQRFTRAVSCKRFSDQQLSLFVEEEDDTKYHAFSSNVNGGGKLSGPETNGRQHCKDADAQATCFTLSDLEGISRLRVTNRFATVAEFRTTLRNICFTDPELLRPSWDTYFMSLAKLAAERTNCMKRRVGCVIARNKRIVATGYNGTPSGVTNCSQGGCPRCNGVLPDQGVGLDLCLCLHAEENAIIEAGRERCEGSTLYTNLFPCILCSKKIVQSGISRVVFDKHYSSDGPSQNLLRAGRVVVDNFARDDVCNLLSRFTINHVAV